MQYLIINAVQIISRDVCCYFKYAPLRKLVITSLYTQSRTRFGASRTIPCYPTLLGIHWWRDKVTQSSLHDRDEAIVQSRIGSNRRLTVSLACTGDEIERRDTGRDVERARDWGFTRRSRRMRWRRKRRNEHEWESLHADPSQTHSLLQGYLLIVLTP